MNEMTSHEGLVLAIVILTCLTGKAINPGCRCIRFTSIFGKDWGAFSSPDYPASYPPGIPCLLYSFMAPKDFIVQLQMEHVHLPVHPNGCHAGDYVKIFQHLDEEGVNEETPWNSLVCGQMSNSTYFSASRHLIIQFHSATSSHLSPLTLSTSKPDTSVVVSVLGKSYGFRGSFRFLNSSQFESSGRLVAGTKCDYRFESHNYSSPEGKFFSPYFPSNYPHNVMCAYLFRASRQERVKIVFESVALEPQIYSCLNKTDVIRVLDGPNPRSPVIALICNSINEFEIVSSGQDLLVEFIGNSDSPGTGFRAKFHFIKVIYDNPYDPLRFNLQQYFPKLEINKHGEDGQPQASTLVPQCDSMISSDSGSKGSFSTPNYPNAYQAKSHCRFDFIGHGRERVQISFVDFDLFHSEGIYIPKSTTTTNTASSTRNFSKNSESDESGKKCGYSDIVSAFVYSNGIRTKVLDHCGPNPPPDFMSNDHRMTLEFSAKASTTIPSVRGFYAQYAFVEDFGLTNGAQLTEYPCAFVFNMSITLNGSVSSPNYPGFYPRETECHYFFHAEAGYHVELHFDHIDIAGLKPCASEKDDYVEISNYMPTDPRFVRKCGRASSSSSLGFGISSEGKFFRLTFRSNDGWGDGTGFRAMFTFTNKINQITIVNVNSLAPAGSLRRPRSLILPLLFSLGRNLAIFPRLLWKSIQ